MKFSNSKTINKSNLEINLWAALIRLPMSDVSLVLTLSNTFSKSLCPGFKKKKPKQTRIWRWIPWCLTTTFLKQPHVCFVASPQATGADGVHRGQCGRSWHRADAVHQRGLLQAEAAAARLASDVPAGSHDGTEIWIHFRPKCLNYVGPRFTRVLLQFVRVSLAVRLWFRKQLIFLICCTWKPDTKRFRHDLWSLC